MTRYIRSGWHVILAYVVGFFLLLVTLGWHPEEKNRARTAAPPPPEPESTFFGQIITFDQHQDTGEWISAKPHPMPSRF
ncbi:MAG: hypothetical protein R2751_07175 [Bacteroidales bacterium]